jgi:hypothetical protein
VPADSPVPDRYLHPDDRADVDESGPWLVVFVVATLVWAALVVAEGRLPAGLGRATAHVVSTLLAAPLAAAAIVQDARAFDAGRRAAAGDGGGPADRTGRPVGGFGKVAWVYGFLAVLVPPSGVVYLLDRWRRSA